MAPQVNPGLIQSKEPNLSSFQKMAPAQAELRGPAWIIAEAAEAYFRQSDRNIAQRVMPVVSSPGTSFTYPNWDLGDQLLTGQPQLSPGQPRQDIGIDVRYTSGVLEPSGEQYPIADYVTADNRTGKSLVEVATETLMNRALNKIDKQFADDYFKAGVWEDATTPSADKKWSAEGGEPIFNVLDGLDSIDSNGGNASDVTMVISRPVFTALLKSKQIRETAGLGQYQAAGQLPNIARIAEAMNVRQIVVARSLSSEGNYRFGKHCLLLDSPDNKNMNEACAMMMVAWDGGKGLAPFGVSTRMVRDEINTRDLVQLDSCWTMVTQNTKLGYFIPNVIA